VNLGLAGRVAIVTGGSRGIGRAIAEVLAEEGCRLCLVARDEEGLRQAASGFGTDVITVAVDLTTPDGPDRIVEATRAQLGGIDILVNNTGASLGGGLDDTDAETLEASFRVNVEAPFLLSKLVLPAMRETGFGRIVMLASIYGREAGGKLAYNVTKASETSLVKALAREVAAYGVTVNSVAPGSIRYPGGSWDRRVQADPEGMRRFVEQELPVRRFGQSREVANVVAFLCSEQASLVNGASVVVDGGQGRSNI